MTMATTQKSTGRPGRRIDLQVIGPILALIALLLIGMALNSNFLSYANITNVLARSAFIGIIAVGMTFVITAGGLDLSVGSMAAFVAGLMILVMNLLTESMGVTLPVILIGIAVALLAGLVAGVINGILITRVGIEAFIVTLGTMGIYRSLITWLADGGTLSLGFEMRELYRPVYYGGIAGVSWPIIAFVVVAVLGEIVMRHTAFGRHCAAIGSNEKVARYSSISVLKVRLATYVLLGLLVGFAVVMYVPRLGSASASTGLLWELEAIAAVIIGGTLLKGGFGRVWGTVVGVLILSLIGNILNLTDFVSPYLNGAIQGAVIILAVVLQRKGATER
ncbi:monosaccharide ABC transporter membrane protein, CUT2 family (TC 3.A.1.2.-) [Salipiger thiooxidans]|uniref:Monosaccharide ABC transporter membrane protein, CUT2 family (TC 3.A.1.2.-) n=1 Tax=Salipiger thiooxidans TaxID=282683 RepID=A0A1G7FPU7_9RHOB|nr:ABC transporter permease [Salipiger thiooxidans]SDE77907.1 monosaccharide ABC transporter membrane protein, CUT2 family (TC 3.A.1.2.-) [Salipiger thiooxidans]